MIEISWQIAHRVPRTGHRLVSTFGMSHIPIACLCYPWSVETLDQLFFSCPLAQAVLSWLQSLLFRCSALIPPLMCRHVLFGFNSEELRVVPPGFAYMLNVSKYFLRSARNDYRFWDIAPCSCTVCAQVCARVRFHLPLLFKRFRSSRRRRYFVRQWGARGSVASIVYGKLVVHLWVHWMLFPASLPGPFFSPYSVPSVLWGSTLSFVVCACLFNCFCLLWMLAPALLPGPFFHQIARHQSRGVFPVTFNVIVSSK